MQQPSNHAVTRMLRRARILPALLALALIATTVPVSAHSGTATDYHAVAVAEGGSTLFTYDPPGIDPPQEYWNDANIAILHRQDCTTLPCKDYYRATFRINSWKGVFSDDDSIYAAPGDPQYIQYNIRIGLYSRDINTGAVTQLTTNIDSWSSSGNYSYGCEGTGRETQVVGTSTKNIFAQIWVWGTRKYYYLGNWYNGPSSSQYWHTTTSKDLESLTYEFTHFQVNNATSGIFVRPISQTNIPNAVYRGTCPFATVMT
jgi:hypothetical protein